MTPRQFQITSPDRQGGSMSWVERLFPGVTGTPRAALLEEQLSAAHEELIDLRREIRATDELLDDYDVPKAGLSLWERVDILGERCAKAKAGSTG